MTSAAAEVGLAVVAFQRPSRHPSYSGTESRLTVDRS